MIRSSLSGLAFGTLALASPAMACSIGVPPSYDGSAAQEQNVRHAIERADLIIDGEVVRAWTPDQPALVRVHRTLKGTAGELIEVGGPDAGKDCSIALDRQGEKSRMILRSGHGRFDLYHDQSNAQLEDRILGSDRRMEWSTPPFAGMDCEVHVWALGRPNFTPKSNAFVKYTPPSAEQLADPHSTVNIFSAVKRAEALGEEPLRALFPGAASLTVVRHAEMIDMDTTPIKAIKGRLSDSQSACYGDLVIANLYAIFPNPDAPYVQYGVVGGLLASAIAGSDRLVVDFWFQQWPGIKGKPLVVRRKNDTPLPHVAPASADMAAAVRDSADANLILFAETVAGKRGG